MTTTIDAEKLLTYIDANGITGSAQVARGWDHMGAVIVDAVLQRRQRYKSTVEPRVRALIAAWPDAETASGFRARINGGDLGTVIRWKSTERLQQIDEILGVFESKQINTVSELRDRLASAPERDELRAALRRIKHVGPKTLDYFDILAGSFTTVAIDVRIRKLAAKAGIIDHAYPHLSAVIHEAAAKRGWRPGDLDAALWNA
ncbi:hypothetical protein [Paeniglutamicibacter antarcticus]|uniref:Uncharacterized protein n=1 Tax=Paeniglutamicibacter antarcticus TaxID=494023 RepID=A0ABP9TP99_9MICC